MPLRIRLVAFVLLALSGSSCSAFKHHETKLELNHPSISVENERMLQNGTPFTGVIFGRHGNGKQALRGHYVDGLKNGIYETFHFDGNRLTRSQYRKGKKEGKQLAWYAEGPKRYEADYKNGLLEGRYVEWHQNGQVFRDQQFHDGTELAQKMFFQNGATYSNYVVKDNRIYGEKSSPLCRETKKEGEK